MELLIAACISLVVAIALVCGWTKLQGKEVEEETSI